MSNRLSQSSKRKTAITALVLCVMVLGLFVAGLEFGLAGEVRIHS